MSWEDEIPVRINEADRRREWGEPEFREALGYIGRRLGLTGTYHLVTDVLPAFDRFMATRPEDSARLLQRLQYALEKAPNAERSVMQLGRALRKLEKDWREASQEVEGA